MRERREKREGERKRQGVVLGGQNNSEWGRETKTEDQHCSQLTPGYTTK